MQNCFRSLEREGVRHLLIGGQASVAYGAATFSEAVDLWVDPAPANFAALSRALRRAHAVIHKLTPPLESGYAPRGHGFHFVLPPDDAGPVFLDVMGRPPRVGPFARALARSTRVATAWGRIPVVGIPDLVELKKTRRAGDYDVITNLVRIRLAAAGPNPGIALLRWGLANCFRLDAAARILTVFPRSRRAAASLSLDWSQTLLAGWKPGEDIAETVAIETQGQLTAEMGRHQQGDIRYWSDILEELRTLRRAGGLLPEGRPL